IYSLGVVIYELLTGQRPFAGSRNDMLQAIQFATPARPAALVDVPESLENICLRAMEKRPEDRYQTAGDLAADLELFLAGGHVSAVNTERTGTLQGSTAKLAEAGEAGEAPPNRRRFLSWAAGSAMFAGLGTASLLLTREPEDGKRVALVTTDPPGANVAFVPVDPVSGDVIPSELEHASGVTPLRHRLRP
ncbi:MAG: hypothetical protein KDA90_24345, partial [Planctomycetaceae bacterium]|nr:hypothetical protein [Planctomycetaceae bacterium]